MKPRSGLRIRICAASRCFWTLMFIVHSSHPEWSVAFEMMLWMSVDIFLSNSQPNSNQHFVCKLNIVTKYEQAHQYILTSKQAVNKRITQTSNRLTEQTSDQATSKTPHKSVIKTLLFWGRDTVYFSRQVTFRLKR